jgi:hypothetical protein
MKEKNNFIILIFILSICISSCKSFNKDYIDNFNPNGRLVELKIDALFKKKIMGKIVNEIVNQDLKDSLNTINKMNNNGLMDYSNEFNYALSVLGEIQKEDLWEATVSSYQARFDYMSNVISNSENIDSLISNPPTSIYSDNKDYVEYVEDKNYSEAENTEIQEKQKENIENIEYVLQVLSYSKELVNKIVFSELKLIAQDKNYHVYEFSILNNNEEFESMSFSIKVKFDEDGMYSGWEEI